MTLVLPDGTELFSRACCWCQPPRFLTVEDEAKAKAGARISHSICPACEQAWDNELRANEARYADPV